MIMGTMGRKTDMIYDEGALYCRQPGCKEKVRWANGRRREARGATAAGQPLEAFAAVHPAHTGTGHRCRPSPEHRRTSVKKVEGPTYGIEVDRKTVSNNLSWLSELDERVRCDVKARSDGHGGIQEVSSGWHCEPALEAEELRYLADALLSCRECPRARSGTCGRR